MHDGLDLSTTDGLDLGQITDHAGDITLTDMLGGSHDLSHSANGIDMLLDTHNHVGGFMDQNGEFNIDGHLGHLEPGALGGVHLVDDLHPENDVNIDHGPQGDIVSDANFIPGLIAKARFGV